MTDEHDELPDREPPNADDVVRGLLLASWAVSVNAIMRDPDTSPGMIATSLVGELEKQPGFLLDGEMFERKLRAKLERFWPLMQQQAAEARALLNEPPPERE
jgi:hypothetical protein